jgi:hypothetical protein
MHPWFHRVYFAFFIFKGFFKIQCSVELGLIQLVLGVYSPALKNTILQNYPPNQEKTLSYRKFIAMKRKLFLKFFSH